MWRATPGPAPWVKYISACASIDETKSQNAPILAGVHWTSWRSMRPRSARRERQLVVQREQEAERGLELDRLDAVADRAARALAGHAALVDGDRLVGGVGDGH